MIKACFLALFVLLSGCATQQSSVQTVRVLVPVPCPVAEPEAPIYPTAHLLLDADLDAVIQAALAEIELREGYELQLRAALKVCLALP